MPAPWLTVIPPPVQAVVSMVSSWVKSLSAVAALSQLSLDRLVGISARQRPAAQPAGQWVTVGVDPLQLMRSSPEQPGVQPPAASAPPPGRPSAARPSAVTTPPSAVFIGPSVAGPPPSAPPLPFTQ